jgi:hypothetical protein
MGFMTLVWKNHFLQHAENGANTNTSVLLPEAKNIVNTVVLGFRDANNIGIYGYRRL